jgi:hypothetical protein
MTASLAATLIANQRVGCRQCRLSWMVLVDPEDFYACHDHSKQAVNSPTGLHNTKHRRVVPQLSSLILETVFSKLCCSLQEMLKFQM